MGENGLTSAAYCKGMFGVHRGTRGVLTHGPWPFTFGGIFCEQSSLSMGSFPPLVGSFYTLSPTGSFLTSSRGPFRPLVGFFLHLVTYRLSFDLFWGSGRVTGFSALKTGWFFSASFGFGFQPVTYGVFLTSSEGAF